jgi:hypothetical protein
MIVSNTAESGGGLELFYSSATLSGNLIASNMASGGSGGGLALGFSPAMLGGNVITTNHARHGGGISLYGAGTFSGNTVASNTADYGGGGLDVSASDATFINNFLTDNQAGIEGSGLRIGYDSSPRLYHTTVVRNSGGEGSGILLTGDSRVELFNTILVSQTVGITVTAGSAVTLSGTLWGSGAWANGANWGGNGIIVTETVNVFGDLDFVNPAARDYHIGPYSAARDAGVNAGILVDIDHQPRQPGKMDIGADEYWAQQICLPLVLRGHNP